MMALTLLSNDSMNTIHDNDIEIEHPDEVVTLLELEVAEGEADLAINRLSMLADGAASLNKLGEKLEAAQHPETIDVVLLAIDQIMGDVTTVDEVDSHSEISLLADDKDNVVVKGVKQVVEWIKAAWRKIKEWAGKAYEGIKSFFSKLFGRSKDEAAKEEKAAKETVDKFKKNERRNSPELKEAQDKSKTTSDGDKKKANSSTDFYKNKAEEAKKKGNVRASKRYEERAKEQERKETKGDSVVKNKKDSVSKENSGGAEKESSVVIGQSPKEDKASIKYKDFAVQGIALGVAEIKDFVTNVENVLSGSGDSNFKKAMSIIDNYSAPGKHNDSKDPEKLGTDERISLNWDEGEKRLIDAIKVYSEEKVKSYNKFTKGAIKVEVNKDYRKMPITSLGKYVTDDSWTGSNESLAVQIAKLTTSLRSALNGLINSFGPALEEARQHYNALGQAADAASKLDPEKEETPVDKKIIRGYQKKLAFVGNMNIYNSIKSEYQATTGLINVLIAQLSKMRKWLNKASFGLSRGEFEDLMKSKKPFVL